MFVADNRSFYSDMLNIDSLYSPTDQTVQIAAKNRQRELREADQISELMVTLCPTRRAQNMKRSIDILKTRIKETCNHGEAEMLCNELVDATEELHAFQKMYACNSNPSLVPCLLNFNATVQSDARCIAMLLSRKRAAKQLSAWDHQTIIWIALNVNSQAIGLEDLQQMFHLQQKPSHGPQTSWAYFNKRVLRLKEQLGQLVDDDYDGVKRRQLYKKMDHLCNTGHKKKKMGQPLLEIGQTPATTAGKMLLEQTSGSIITLIGNERDGCAYDTLKRNVPRVENHFPQSELRSQNNGFVFFNRLLSRMDSTTLPLDIEADVRWFVSHCLRLFGDVVALCNNHDKHTVDENMTRIFVPGPTRGPESNKRQKGETGHDARDPEENDPYDSMVEAIFDNLPSVSYTTLSNQIREKSEYTWIGEKKRHNRGELFWNRHNEVLVYLALKWMSIVYTRPFCVQRGVGFDAIHDSLTRLSLGKPSYQHTASVRKGIFHGQPGLATWLGAIIKEAGLNPLQSFRVECSYTQKGPPVVETLALPFNMTPYFGPPNSSLLLTKRPKRRKTHTTTNGTVSIKHLNV